LQIIGSDLGIIAPVQTFDLLIGRLTKPDYIDVVDLPANVLLAEWDYKARYVIANNVVGLMSSVVSVILKKQ